MGSLKKKEEDELKCTWVHGPIIVGAGPSGLAVAACLSDNGVPSLVLEKSNCIASLWQYRTYDRLNLHLPKQFCQLPIMGFPKDFPKYPTYKDQFISYMESYAENFSIKPKFKQYVNKAEFDDSGSGVWRVRTDQDVEYMTKWLIVATGENAEPVILQVSGIEKFDGPVIHTSVYKSGADFKNQKVLVVGCGNSGMEVSLDLCSHNASPHMVVRNTVHVLPREMFGFSTFGIAMALLKWLPLRLVDKVHVVAYCSLGNTDQLGLRRPKTGPLELKNATGKTPVLDVGALSKIKSGKIKVMEGVRELTRRGAKFIDGQEKEFDSIILATGHKSNVPSWLKLLLLLLMVSWMTCVGAVPTLLDPQRPNTPDAPTHTVYFLPPPPPPSPPPPPPSPSPPTPPTHHGPDPWVVTTVVTTLGVMGCCGGNYLYIRRRNRVMRMAVIKLGRVEQHPTFFFFFGGIIMFSFTCLMVFMIKAWGGGGLRHYITL